MWQEFKGQRNKGSTTRENMKDALRELALLKGAITSPYLSSSCLVAHEAFTESLHASRLAATVFTSSHDRYPSSALSFSTVRLQVVFGLPLLRRRFGPVLMSNHLPSTLLLLTSLLIVFMFLCAMLLEYYSLRLILC